MAALGEKYLPDYEVLVFDDASTDRTGKVVQEIKKKDPHVHLYRNPVNKGLGFNYREGILKARCRYSIMIPGDHEVISESLVEIFKQLGTTDIIICSSTNPEVRPPVRQFISKVFTATLNLLFGLKVRYYNGPAVVRTDLAKDYLPSTYSFAYMAVILVQLLRLGYSCQHLTFSLRPRRFGRTKAFQFKNVVAVLRDITKLFWKVQILRTLDKDAILAATVSSSGLPHRGYPDPSDQNQQRGLTGGSMDSHFRGNDK